MSGRSLHLREGEYITNRKTDRRQSKARPLIDRLHALNDRGRQRWPSDWKSDVRMAFLLPKTLAAFLATGAHGHGVYVFKGFVQIRHGSFEECCVSAQHFFADVAKGWPAFTVLASITSNQDPSKRYARSLSIVNGSMVVSAASVDPVIYEGG